MKYSKPEIYLHLAGPPKKPLATQTHLKWEKMKMEEQMSLNSVLNALEIENVFLKKFSEKIVFFSEYFRVSLKKNTSFSQIFRRNRYIFKRFK